MPKNVLKLYSEITKTAPIFLYNTLTRQREEFVPIHKGSVGLYTCGPTVYNYAHIGNLRTYIFNDILRRVLEFNKLKVNHVMNVTDVGHLVSDSDEGADKMENGAKREGKDVWTIAKQYTETFFNDCTKLNMLPPTIVCKATDHINEQIELVKELEKKGYTYKTPDGIYFDSSKFATYGELALIDKEGLQAGKRVSLKYKKNSTDFALWKFSSTDEKRQMEWNSPWGKGFPGWHIECSAMAMKYLGRHFDIHTGGTDHIPIHHTNEIAQSEAATGEKFVNYWLHGNFLIVEQDKMSKSGGDFLTLEKVVSKGFDPIDYRYLCLTVHYRKNLSFTWENLKASKESLIKIRRKMLQLKNTIAHENYDHFTKSAEIYDKEFMGKINDDLNIPSALAVLHKLLRDTNVLSIQKYASVLGYDTVLGLGLSSVENTVIPAKIIALADEREVARKRKDWKASDEIRKRISETGFSVEDTNEGYKIVLKN